MFNSSEIAELQIERVALELQTHSHLLVGRRISFVDCPFIFGRPTNTQAALGLYIPSMRISKLHAEISFEQQRYWLIRHSRNLVALNRRELERGQRYALEDGDSVIFAGVIKFQVHLSAGDTWPVMPKGIWVGSTPYPTVKINGQPLTPSLQLTEFRFLEILFNHAGNTVMREQILEHIWPNEYATEGQLDHVAHRVRARLKAVDSSEFVVTQRGMGYKLAQPQLTLDQLLEENQPAPEDQHKVCSIQTT
jgi:DNA-binding winged helix-turn-helix (wHTH) protein